MFTDEYKKKLADKKRGGSMLPSEYETISSYEEAMWQGRDWRMNTYILLIFIFGVISILLNSAHQHDGDIWGWLGDIWEWLGDIWLWVRDNDPEVAAAAAGGAGKTNITGEHFSALAEGDSPHNIMLPAALLMFIMFLNTWK